MAFEVLTAQIREQELGTGGRRAHELAAVVFEEKFSIMLPQTQDGSIRAANLP